VTFFYSLHSIVGLGIIVAVCVVLACTGHVIVHRTFKRSDFIEYNDVAGFVVAVVGVLYAVLVAFVTVVVWEHYQESETRAQLEANAAADIWRLSQFVPGGTAKLIENDLERYVRLVLTDDWPKMRLGEESARTTDAVVALIGDIARFEPRTPQQTNVQSHLLERVQAVADLRRHRIYDERSGVPGILWIVLIAGGITIVCFLYLFGVRDFTVQLLMTAATAIIIGLSFGLIVELDYPFRGDVSVTPERWATLLTLMEEKNSGTLTPSR
jgi:hypothetical protein